MKMSKGDSKYLNPLKHQRILQINYEDKCILKYESISLGGRVLLYICFLLKKH